MNSTKKKHSTRTKNKQQKKQKQITKSINLDFLLTNKHVGDVLHVWHLFFQPSQKICQAS